MLGADNYYGGVICCLNKQDKFRAFNERITDKAAQLGGIYYQGLTHLQRALGGRRDEYQRKLRANAELLYGLLNPDGEALSSVGHQKEPIVEVVRMQEGSRLFLTLRPLHQALAEDELPKLACAIAERLAKQGVTVTHRASFGFRRTNIIVFAGSKGMRITAGLEGADAIKAIASAIQEALNVFVRPKT
ncbi:MAG: hypothetical protein KDK78_06560 [Chlamydiia bacterium]|nr:hypothetical protein [Chlamydiia bacterium]